LKSFNEVFGLRVKSTFVMEFFSAVALLGLIDHGKCERCESTDFIKALPAPRLFMGLDCLKGLNLFCGIDLNHY